MNVLSASDRTGSVACWHCGEAVSRHGHWPVVIDGIERETCCAGCQAVAQSIGGAGLSDYYRVRDRPALPQTEGPDIDVRLYDEPDVAARFIRRSGAQCEATLLVDGMRCGACVWLLEQTLRRVPGVTDVRINLGSERAQLSWDADRTTLSQLIDSARRIGYTLLPHDREAREAQVAAQSRARLRRLFVAGIGMMQVMMYAVPVYLAGPGEIEPQFEALMRWASLALTLPVLFYSATPFFLGAWRDVRSMSPGMDTPVALGLAAAFAASVHATVTGQGEVWFDTVTMFVFLLLAARHLEWLARRRASRAIDRLTAARPQAVQKLEVETGQLETVPASRLIPGDRFVVGEGETLAVDAVLLDDRARFDQSLLTGESLPVSHQQGDAVPGGAINLGGARRMQALSTWADSTLSTLGHLAERASSGRPRITALTDRVAQWFVGGLLVFAAIVGLIWLQIDPDRALPIAIAVLVVSCPCALSLATPAALAAASGHALARGWVLARSDALESMAQITDVVFDKTGTLTAGTLSLTEIRTVDSASERNPSIDGSDRWLAIASALEQGSPHPVARALRAAAAARGLDSRIAEGLRSTPGQGIEGTIDQLSWRIGRLDFVCAAHSCEGGGTGVQEPTPAPTGMLEVWLGHSGRPIAQFIFDDPVRPESARVIQALREHGLTVHLLSGDRAQTVAHVARPLGIEHVRGDATPEDKLAWVQAMQQQGRRVLMVGDGINDAPVLAGANVSVAVGQASALARISADVVLLGNGLSPLTELHRLARNTRSIIRQNLSWAMAYNVLAIPLAALGWVSGGVAALGMSLSSLLVAANALRLLPARTRPQPPDEAPIALEPPKADAVPIAGLAERV